MNSKRSPTRSKWGKACDEEDFLWYEDPYRDGGISQHAHRKLRQHLETPILQTEHLRGLEPFTDFAATEATDFLRADPEYDGGITGVMKRARVAEGFGLDVLNSVSHNYGRLWSNSLHGCLA